MLECFAGSETTCRLKFEYSCAAAIARFYKLPVQEAVPCWRVLKKTFYFSRKGASPVEGDLPEENKSSCDWLVAIGELEPFAGPETTWMLKEMRKNPQLKKIRCSALVERQKKR